MKKIALFVGTLTASTFLLTGCGDESKTLTCAKDTDSNGLKSTITYNIQYKSDDVEHVKITYDYNKSTQTDGIGTGTDGTTQDTNEDEDGIVDGKVKEGVDNIVDSIQDLTGIRSTHENRLNTYKNYKGFTSHVDTDNNDRYKVVYEIDLKKISDTDLANFNINRSLKSTRSGYEAEGLTCK